MKNPYILYILFFINLYNLFGCSTDNIEDLQKSENQTGVESFNTESELCLILNQKGFKMSGLLNGEYWVLGNSINFRNFEDSAIVTQDSGFYFNKDGILLNMGSNLPILGYAWNHDSYSSDLDVIRIPSYQILSREATTSIELKGNLNSDSDARGTILNTQAYFHRALQRESISILYNSDGQLLNIKDGDKITISAMSVPDKQLTFVSDPAKVSSGNSFNTYEELTTAINDFVKTHFNAQIVASSTKLGALELTPGDSNISGLTISSDNPLSNVYLQNAIAFPQVISKNSAAIYTNQLLSPAVASDVLDDVFDKNGHKLGIQNGDIITVNANVGNVPIINNKTITYVSNSPKSIMATTFQDVLNLIQDELHLPPTDGSFQPQNSVSINEGGSNDNLTDGSIVVRGQKGLDFAITGLSIQANDLTQIDGSPSNFNANNNIVSTQKARDLGIVEVNFFVYDNLLNTHDLSFKMNHLGVPGVWYWELKVGGNENVQSGFQGKVVFGLDGSVLSFSANDQSPFLILDPRTGADVMKIKIDAGGPGNFKGLTQFEADFSAVAQSGSKVQVASIQSVQLDSTANLWASYANGSRIKVAQLAKAHIISTNYLNSYEKLQVPSLNVLYTPKNNAPTTLAQKANLYELNHLSVTDCFKF